MSLIICDSEEQQRRRSICESCEHKNGKRCGLCGCFLYGISKLKYKDCPAGKWKQNEFERKFEYDYSQFK